MEVPYVNIHTHRRSGEGVEVVSVMAALGALPQEASKLPFSLGIHPWQLTDLDAIRLGDMSAALDAIEASDAIAIGEIGLDYAVASSRVHRIFQERAFTMQLRLAEFLGRPVIIHCVKAFEPTMAILARYRLPAVILHGFIGSEQQAARATGRGYFLSFGERSLASPKTVQALRCTPLKYLFLETDVSPLSIRDIYAQAASSLQIPIEGLAQQLFANYQEVFGNVRSVA